jgi:hypothetical protein
VKGTGFQVQRSKVQGKLGQSDEQDKRDQSNRGGWNPLSHDENRQVGERGNAPVI